MFTASVCLCSVQPGTHCASEAGEVDEDEEEIISCKTILKLTQIFPYCFVFLCMPKFIVFIFVYLFILFCI